MTVEEKSEGTQMAEPADSPEEEAPKAIEEPIKEKEAEEEEQKPISSTEEKEEKKEEKPISSTEEKEEKKEDEKSADPKSDSDAKKNHGDELPKSEQPPDSPAKAIEKSSSFKEESNSLSDLKETERKALIDFKAKIEEAIAENTLFKAQEENDGEVDKKEEVSLWGVSLLPSKNSEATDVVLLKFLRAREFKVKESFEMLQNTLHWRKKEKIDSIADEVELGADFAAGCYMDGYDREGHPVCYNVPSVFRDEEVYKKAFGSVEGRRKFLRWRVQLMEKGIETLDLRPGGVSNLLQVTDLMNSVGPSKKELRDAMKQAVQILQDNYPEFVARNMFINVPFWYYAFNALLSPFFTQRTKSKFVFARPSQTSETLLK